MFYTSQVVTPDFFHPLRISQDGDVFLVIYRVFACKQKITLKPQTIDPSSTY